MLHCSQLGEFEECHMTWPPKMIEVFVDCWHTIKFTWSCFVWFFFGETFVSHSPNHHSIKWFHPSHLSTIPGRGDAGSCEGLHKITEIIEGFCCLNKARYLLFQHHWVHSFRFMIYLLWLCRWWCFAKVPLTVFGVFLPTFRSISRGWFAQQSCRTRGRPSGGLRKWPNEMAGCCSEFNGKKPETLQKPDFGKKIERLDLLSIQEIWEFRSRLLHHLEWCMFWDGLYPHDGVYVEINM